MDTVARRRGAPWLFLGLCLVWLLGWAPAHTAAQSVESVLRPGELVRSHAKWEDECGQCHVRFDRNAQNSRCMDCHKPIARDVREHTGWHGRLKPQPCRACHTDHKGRDARIAEFDKQKFDHQQTDFALLGKHQSTTCVKCHVGGKKYSEAALECNACHGKDDAHKGGLGKTCGDCHSESDWKQTRFDHGKTRFALAGRHAETPCLECHKNSVYKDTARACVSCHRKDDDSTRGHRGRFGERCDTCHGAKAWKPSIFNHDTDTRWTLRGRHRGAACSACHSGYLYREKTASACVDCHVKDDKHKGSLGRECQACHVERDWKETSRFDHDKTQFALLGKHRDTKCDACHQGGRYKGTETACVACHRKDDAHQGGLGVDCKSCHVERSWQEAPRFDHARSRFALLGKHREVRCADCHKPVDKLVGKSANKLIDYRATPSDCHACHGKDDKHQTTLGTACADCHSERDWKSAPKFDHQRTRFALRGGHAAREVSCKSCHADLRSYRKTALECVACHKKDDKHEGQLGTSCESCHDDARWKSTRFDHARARFVLVGRHLRVECKSCHDSARYRDAARECVGCHSKDDKHKLTLGVACESCHNARDWRVWSFDHNKRTRFVLDGAHRALSCERCHSAPAPRGKPIAEVDGACLSCHRKDDKHDGAFGPQCERCHSTSNWRQIANRVGATSPPLPPSPLLTVSTRSTLAPASALPRMLGHSSWFARVAARGRFS